MKLLVATLALLSCVMASTPDVFLGGDSRQLAATLNELPKVCMDVLADFKITEYKMKFKGTTKTGTLDATLQLNLDKNLFDCNLANWKDTSGKGKAKPEFEQVKHLVYYMDTPNDHNNPYDNIDVHQAGCNCDTDQLLNLCKDGETLTQKLVSDDCKAKKAANPSWVTTEEIEVCRSGCSGSYYIMKTAGGEEDPGVAMVIEYHFDNEVYDRMIKDKFYALNTVNDGRNDGKFSYEESKWAWIHEVFILQSFDKDVTPNEFGWGLSRWWEFEMMIRFYLTLVPVRSDPFKVIAREVSVPACPNCKVVFQQTAILEFVEEKDRTDTEAKCPPVLTEVDWTVQRDLQRPFCSLEKVLMRIYMEGITNPRKFVLQKFEFDYAGRDSWLTIYDRQKDVSSGNSEYFETPVWNPTLKQLQLTITNLALGQSQKNLMYQAQVRVCKFDDSATADTAGTEANWSCDPVFQSEGTIEEGGTGSGPGGRRRLLAKDKEIVQQYKSADTAYDPDSNEAPETSTGGTTAAKEESGSALPIIIVVVVIAVCIGIGVGVYFHMKKKGGKADQQAGDQGERA